MKPIKITCTTCTTCTRKWIGPSTCSGCDIIDQVAPKEVVCEHAEHCRGNSNLYCAGFHLDPHEPYSDCDADLCPDSPSPVDSARCIPVVHHVDRLINDLCDKVGPILRPHVLTILEIRSWAKGEIIDNPLMRMAENTWTKEFETHAGHIQSIIDAMDKEEA